MTATLKWKPVKNKGCLPYGLRRKLEDVLPKTFDYRDVQYLKGLADCGIEGAQELIDLIDKYGEVELSLEY